MNNFKNILLVLFISSLLTPTVHAVPKLYRLKSSQLTILGGGAAKTIFKVDGLPNDLVTFNKNVYQWKHHGFLTIHPSGFNPFRHLRARKYNRSETGRVDIHENIFARSNKSLREWVRTEAEVYAGMRLIGGPELRGVAYIEDTKTLGLVVEYIRGTQPRVVTPAQLEQIYLMGDKASDAGFFMGDVRWDNLILTPGGAIRPVDVELVRKYLNKDTSLLSSPQVLRMSYTKEFFTKWENYFDNEGTIIPGRGQKWRFNSWRGKMW